MQRRIAKKLVILKQKQKSLLWLRSTKYTPPVFPTEEKGSYARKECVRIEPNLEAHFVFVLSPPACLTSFNAKKGGPAGHQILCFKSLPHCFGGGEGANRPLPKAATNGEGGSGGGEK